mgnify:CR=1 FL=1
MIQIDIKGLEIFESLSVLLGNTDIMYQLAYDTMLDILETFIKSEIMNDPNIPEEYKAGVTLVMLPSGFVILYYVEEEWRKKEKTTRLEWAIYRCPKRKYYGGKLRPSVEYMKRDYIKEKWLMTKDFYLSMFQSIFRAKLIDYLRGRL